MVLVGVYYVFCVFSCVLDCYCLFLGFFRVVVIVCIGFLLISSMVFRW